MLHEPWHTPDFTAPDVRQPALQQADLTTPAFTLPDPGTPDLVIQLSLWPDDLEQLITNQPDPASPDLTSPELPASLDVPMSDAHAMPTPRNEPEVVMAQPPGEMDPAALETLLSGADYTELPPGLSYPQLYSVQDEMSTRKRHVGMLELGLERSERAEP